MSKRAQQTLLKLVLSDLTHGTAKPASLSASSFSQHLRRGEGRAASVAGSSFANRYSTSRAFSKVAVTDPTGTVVTAEGDIPGAPFGKKSTPLDENWSADTPAQTKSGEGSPAETGGTFVDNLKFFAEGATSVAGQAVRKVEEAVGLRKPESSKERDMQPEGIMEGASGRIDGNDRDAKYDELKRTAKDTWDDQRGGRGGEQVNLEQAYPDTTEVGDMTKKQPSGPAGLNRAGHKDDQAKPWSQ